MLADAYRHGIFPWPIGENVPYIPWASPEERGVLFCDKLHIPHGLKREMKKFKFEFRVDTAFQEVIANCAKAARPGQDESWITGAMIEVYTEFHELGYAHSFETFDKNGELAGGLYGISIGRIFCGESMFYRVSGASKFAFVKMVEFLQNRGVVLIDTQMVTNATAAFGAQLISRKEYLELLDIYGGEPLDFRSGK
jgi:leucyl/phenylalanyl-tRNA--protein transferase